MYACINALIYILFEWILGFQVQVLAVETSFWIASSQVALLEEMAANGETLNEEMLNYPDQSGRVSSEKSSQIIFIFHFFWPATPSNHSVPIIFEL